MTFFDVLVSGRMLTGIVLFGLLAAAEPFLEEFVERVFADNPPAHWSWTHLGEPLLRAVLVLGFVLFTYPMLFGLREAPPLDVLLAAEEARASTVLGVLFLLALCAPVLPVVLSHPEFVLPAQGILATGFLFSWLTSWLHISAVSLWPGADLAFAIVLTAWLARRFAASTGRAADAATGRAGCDARLTHVITLQAQLPVIILYAVGLGRQIAI
jgi:hypothetical protein